MICCTKTEQGTKQRHAKDWRTKATKILYLLYRYISLLLLIETKLECYRKLKKFIIHLC